MFSSDPTALILYVELATANIQPFELFCGTWNCIILKDEY
jgi:hypothetical protein